ncbi:hypothetical protein CCR75_002713 [Bremia lactucae]|uniref:Uncharacterized protein n=1 Tax=Bremia lactucae TaxID=4779 RepID=A0A976IGD0_BRELC|nr:hypothetical protein CCR75_002713 [Bremia lactucae]
MLQAHEAERISANDLVTHPWFGDETATSDSSSEALEFVRMKECEALGFAELLSRGFQVVKYSSKGSTQPYLTTLTLNFLEESVTWTARKNLGMPALQSQKRKRAIRLCEINEIRRGYTTKAFQAQKHLTSMPRPKICLSIICSWRTLDLVGKAPSQREFLVRGIRRLLQDAAR